MNLAENYSILINENGASRVCILDFGIAPSTAGGTNNGSTNITTPGTVIGTFGCMPLEQLKGEPTGERADLFAVGVMIYEAITGEKPFRGQTYMELLRALDAEPEIDLTDSAMRKFFNSAFAAKLADRFASAEEMEKNLIDLSETRTAAQS